MTLLSNENIMGRLTIFPYKEKIGALDLYIEEEWRCKWLSKSFAKFMYQTLMSISKKYNLMYIFTKINNPKSIRLVDFFEFKRYNNYYYLTII